MLSIVCLSDTHNQHRQIKTPECDILIHSGDISYRGTEHEIYDFLEWYAIQPGKTKILVPGNHDFYLEDLHRRNKLTTFGMSWNVMILHNRMVEINGLKIYGTADQPWFHNWAFNRSPEQLTESYFKIPEVDILVTHTPPYGILDRVRDYDKYHRVGSKELLKVLQDIKPKIHCFGHIHEDAGIRGDHETLFINAAYLDQPGRVKKPNLPVWIRFQEKVLSYGYITSEGGLPPLPGETAKLGETE